VGETMNNDSFSRPVNNCLVQLILTICLVWLLMPVPFMLSFNGYGAYTWAFVALQFAACAVLLANIGRCFRTLSDDSRRS
jgi:hypothetical protein